MSQPDVSKYPWPRRRLIRGLTKAVLMVAFGVLSDFKVEGKENFPDSGPLLVAANHFSFVDPPAVIRAIPWPLDFVGGFQMPNAPASVTSLPKIWGYYPVFRGRSSRTALVAAQAVMAQNGVLGIFPEGGSWATVLRPPRPGVAFLAARTRARILPVGLDGCDELFPRLRKGKRGKITVRIGKPFGPVEVGSRTRADRELIDQLGHDLMHNIAELIPPERRGFYSDDPAIREAAKGTEIYPWDNDQEG